MGTRLLRKLSNLFAPIELLPPFPYDDGSGTAPAIRATCTPHRKMAVEIAPSTHDLFYGLSTLLGRKPSPRA